MYTTCPHGGKFFSRGRSLHLPRKWSDLRAYSRCGGHRPLQFWISSWLWASFWGEAVSGSGFPASRP